MKILMTNPNPYELLAASLVLNVLVGSTIERREPTTDDLEDPNTWCIGCGSNDSDILHNFQRPLAHRKVAKCLELDNFISGFHPWWSASGADVNRVLAGVSMEDRVLLNEFSIALPSHAFHYFKDYTEVLRGWGEIFMRVTRINYRIASELHGGTICKKVDRVHVLYKPPAITHPLTPGLIRLLCLTEKLPFPDVVVELMKDGGMMSFLSIEKFDLSDLNFDPYTVTPIGISASSTDEIESFIKSKIRLQVPS
jgi:hypothetical protein